MTINSLWHKLVDHMQEKYCAIKTASKKISADFKELFQHQVSSIDKMIYVGNSVTQISDEVVDNGTITFQKLYAIKNDFNNLENILFNRVNTNHDINKNTLLEIPIHKTSRLKSIIISTIAGLGTMNSTYDCLRNNDIKSYSGSAVSNPYSVEELNRIIELKNKYFWKNSDELKETILTKTGIIVPAADSIESIVNKAMELKVNGVSYSALNRINYDSTIASRRMKDEFINQYISSEKTLKELSYDLEKKYGMYISSSTISRHARKYLSAKGLEFKNRYAARKYYKNHSMRSKK